MHVCIKIKRTGLGLGLWLVYGWAQAGFSTWSLAPVYPQLCCAYSLLPGGPEDLESKEEIREPGKAAAATARPSGHWREAEPRLTLKGKAKLNPPPGPSKEERIASRREKAKQKALSAKRPPARGTLSTLFSEHAKQSQASSERKSPVPPGEYQSLWGNPKNDDADLPTVSSGGIAFTRRDIIPLHGPYYTLPAKLEHITKRHYSGHPEADNPSQFSSTVIAKAGIQGLLEALLVSPEEEVLTSSLGGGEARLSDGDTRSAIYYLEGAGVVPARNARQKDIQTNYVRIVSEWHDLGDGHTYLVITAYPCIYLREDKKDPYSAWEDDD